ncbi:MAG: GreA/GreB family elongation factor [Candidatus Saccharibacteria bacterium]|nr:GreA/GreB family elongation factor [Candidatus Saccharibacteria bacterium]
MKKELLILEIDKQYARQRIAELDNEIIALGPEFYNAFNQTSESWHDNAPFEFVRDKQTLLSTEMQNLKQILRDSTPSIPRQKKGTVGIGTTVEVLDTKTNKTSRYFIAGDWTANAGHNINGATVISRKSPIAQAIFGKKVDDDAHFKNMLIIKSVEQ